jgi:hypothetical protein
VDSFILKEQNINNKYININSLYSCFVIAWVRTSGFPLGAGCCVSREKREKREKLGVMARWSGAAMPGTICWMRNPSRAISGG